MGHHIREEEVGVRTAVIPHQNSPILHQHQHHGSGCCPHPLQCELHEGRAPLLTSTLDVYLSHQKCSANVLSDRASELEGGKTLERKHNR
jgi:hypothetical protein